MEKRNLEQPIAKGKLIEIPSHHDILWYYDDDVPWVEWFNPKFDSNDFTRKSTGKLRKWLEYNTTDNVYFYISMSFKCDNAGSRVEGYKTALFFDSLNDYLAFKLIFPEFCEGQK